MVDFKKLQKDVYQNKEFKDDEKVIIAHFKILKEF